MRIFKTTALPPPPSQPSRYVSEVRTVRCYTPWRNVSGWDNTEKQNKKQKNLQKIKNENQKWSRTHIFKRKKQQMNGGSRRLNSHSGRKIKMDLAVCSRYSAMASFISFWLLLCSSHNIHRWNRGMNVWCTRDSGLYTHLSVYVSEGLGMPRSSINIALWMKRREKERERAKMQEKEKKRADPAQKSNNTHDDEWAKDSR